MPGIYTHNVIFKKALEIVSDRSAHSFVDKSILSLFNSSDHLKAGLFGAIGPNIFDYTNIRYKWKGYGSDVSFYLHNEASLEYIETMLNIIRGYSDSRNEWASSQRAYLMGYLSHTIADSLIHPFVFYFSGFPSSGNKTEIIRYRKANLQFQYNIDNYFIYKDESTGEISLEGMLPVYISGRRSLIHPPVKALILKSLKKQNIALFSREFKSLSGREIDGTLGYVPGFDMIPRNIRICYNLKRTENQRLKRNLEKLERYPLFYSDFLVRYPGYKRVDMDALNLHQGRWQYPSGRKGFRYESVLHLVKSAAEKTAEAWLALESSFLGQAGADPASFIDVNTYTGERDAGFYDMKVKDILRLNL